MDKSLKVLAECVDIRSGKRFLPGETFDPAPTAAQARRLFKAGCLPEAAIAIGEQVDDDAEAAAEAKAKAEADAAAAAEADAKAKEAAAALQVDGAVIARDQINNDGLFDKSDAELAEIVASEGIDIQGRLDKVAIIAAIRAHRADATIVEAKNVGMRTDDGERDARAADAAAAERATTPRKTTKSAK